MDQPTERARPTDGQLDVPWWNSSDWLAAIVQSSDDAIIGKTLDSVVRSWNAAAERMFGYTADEIVGRPILMIIPPELQYEEAGIVANLSAGRRIDHYETVRLRKDGTRIDVSISVSPIRGGNGDIIGAAKIARDVTEVEPAPPRRGRADRAPAGAGDRARGAGRGGPIPPGRFRDIE